VEQRCQWGEQRWSRGASGGAEVEQRCQWGSRSASWGSRGVSGGAEVEQRCQWGSRSASGGSRGGAEVPAGEQRCQRGSRGGAEVPVGEQKCQRGAEVPVEGGRGASWGDGFCLPNGEVLGEKPGRTEGRRLRTQPGPCADGEVKKDGQAPQGGEVGASSRREE
jgi:hypothetical protein